jgi:hypothetical protein
VLNLADLGPPALVTLDIRQRGVHPIAGSAQVPGAVETV